MSHIEVMRRASAATPQGLSADELQALYAEIPVTIECQGKCQEYCSSIAMSGEEFDIIRETCGYTPRSDPNGNFCPLLTPDGRCSVYAVRPMICRLWSLVEDMQCPWGCKPTPRYLTQVECFSFLLRSGCYGPALPKEAADWVATEKVERNVSFKNSLELLI